MRLLDSLAASYRHYMRGIEGLPGIHLLDIPERFASRTLPLGRYYPIMVETELERIELDHFLRVDRPQLVVPDLLDRRPSSLQGNDILISHYDPTHPSWPWLLLCQWPRIFAEAVPADSDFFARQAYTVEIFSTSLDRAAATKHLLASLAENGLAAIFIER
ncbi:hypothetical protein SAMN05518849_12826 [Sphingobium sp. AP50]|uniref:hypothetical protein n=1 Tax=Sphingobium sp. AP50 TaxID=1884369 RepID=UPI0008AFCD8E|nr:hypothetical protein [Sphingobium sp. AP50]SEK02146.1 hypothetical protein SAMN05518849_12826 [Sphingobium sp. AP50]